MSDSLAAHGYDPADINDVLLNCNYSSELKAAKHLDLQRLFREFGFEDAKIREALLKNDLDEERTLDWLTNS